jgi:hypothetical protein
MARQTLHTSRATAEKRIAAEMAAAKHQEKQSATPDTRHSAIAEAAWLIAERRGFQGDLALDDWLQAEAEVDARLAGKH